MDTRWQPRFALALTLALAACGGDEAAQEAEGPPPAAEAAPGDMAGMPGMATMQMPDEMTVHLTMMEGVSGDSLNRVLPGHRQLVANMLSRMDREMRDMNMAATPDWSALADSLRDDLVRLPELDTGGLEDLMGPHRARVMRLMEMHGSMMRDTVR
jgi:hypothetical protein